MILLVTLHFQYTIIVTVNQSAHLVLC